MQAELLRAPIMKVKIHHLGEEIIFDFKYFEKSTGSVFGTDDSEFLVEPFADINKYWSRLPEDTQLQIFNLYRQMRHVLDTDFELRTLQRSMSHLVTSMMNYHQLDDIDYFMRYNSFIYIPPEIDEVFNPNDINVIGTRDRTYVREDYRQLIVLSVAIRPIGIIWGEYINKIEKQVDTIWKELNAFYLLYDSWVIESRPMQRLDVYVKANVQAEIEESGPESLAPAIIAGISIEDYPTWLLAVTIMKRVVFVDFNQNALKPNIIQNIYNIIRSKLQNPTSTFKNRINKKDLESDVGGEEGKLSLFESYKAKIEIPLGEIAIIEHALSNPVGLAKQLEPNIDMNLLTQILEASQALFHHRIADGQINLIQWTMSNVIPIRIVPYLEKSYVVLAAGITAAVLWSRGFKSLATLVLSYPRENNGDTIIRLGEEAIKVPKDVNDKMEAYYPYARRATSKVPKKKPNPGSVAITNIQKKLSRNQWTTIIPDNLIIEVDGIGNDKHYSAQPDLRLRLTELVININERTKHELPATVSFDNAYGV